MRARFQVETKDGVIFNTEFHVRNKWEALHQLLAVCGIPYDPAAFTTRGDWTEFQNSEATYRVSTRFG